MPILLDEIVSNSPKHQILIKSQNYDVLEICYVCDCDDFPKGKVEITLASHEKVLTLIFTGINDFSTATCSLYEIGIYIYDTSGFSYSGCSPIRVQSRNGAGISFWASTVEIKNSGLLD